MDRCAQHIIEFKKSQADRLVSNYFDLYRLLFGFIFKNKIIG